MRRIEKIEDVGDATKDKIKAMLGMVFLLAMFIFILAGESFYDDADVEEYRRMQQQIREEKLTMGGWQYGNTSTG